MARFSFHAAPAFLLGYGLIRLVDGLDGSYGPGAAWTVGHVLFLVSLVLFGVMLVGLRQLVPTTGKGHRFIATLATVAGIAGLLVFIRVAILDIIVGLRAADHAAMSELSRRYDNVPSVLPAAFGELGPVLFQVGLITLVTQLVLVRPRQLPGWSPVLILLGFASIMVNLNLLCLAATLFWL